MKKLSFSITILLLQLIVRGQITINNSVTPSQLINGFVGSGLTVSNPTMNCPPGYAATFTTSGSCNLGITNGVLLATGAATVAQGPNTSNGASGFNYGTSYSDPQLTAIEPSAVNDVCILEFDIVPSCSTLFIKYVFGSEEYPEYVGSYNDAFGFFITGPNASCSGTPYNNTNIATLPGGTPVSINNVNASTNSSYYVNNAGGSCIQFDGMTVPITSTVNVCPCATYHFKIAIADALDHALDSGVFIDMFACNNPITATATTTLSTCSSTCTGAASITPSGGSGTYTYTWLPSGGSSNYATGLCAGTYTVIVADASGGVCTQSTSVIININGPSVPSFSINLSDDTLTCNNPTISATAVNTNTSISSMNYTFTSISSGTSTANPLLITTPGTYTVFGQDPSTGCVATNTFAVGAYTTVPNVTVSPNTLNIPCTGSAGTFTGTATPTTNVAYSWLQPGGGYLSGNLLTPGAAGTYTFVATNISNGCSNTFTVSVTQSTAAPTMTLTATNNNYNIKCSPNTVTLTINATQAPGGGAPQVYWTNASGTTTLSTANTFTFNNPGNYVGCAYDPAPGGCVVCQTVTIGMDTLKPVGGYTLNIPTNTLTCTYSTAIATGTSAVSGATYVWYTPGTVPQQTLAINSTTNVSQTTIGTYTVEITNPSNGCKRKVPVTFYQDKQPLGLTAKATPSVLTCKDLQTTLQFTPNPISAPLTFTWTTPAPTSTNNVNNPVTFYASGDYTLCTTRLSNGCVSCVTVQVGSNTTPPATTPVPTATIACGYTNTTIYAGTTPSTNITYLWSGPRDATLTSINSYSTTVSTPGIYYVIITNTVNGCVSQNSVSVVNGSITADFTPHPSSGFAPLNVSFINNSYYGNPANLTYYWSFGNGGTVTTVANPTVATPGTSTTYNAPGTYTVMMIMQNGTCIDTVYKVLQVDIPSDIEVPNVFTPNGDGINDYFILHTANLKEIECTIIDRWGAEMYSIKTDKGNIQWDGKTKAGKDAPTGTYFYIIKAKGADDKIYEKKGYLMILR